MINKFKTEVKENLTKTYWVPNENYLESFFLYQRPFIKDGESNIFYSEITEAEKFQLSEANRYLNSTGLYSGGKELTTDKEKEELVSHKFRYLIKDIKWK